MNLCKVHDGDDGCIEFGIVNGSFIVAAHSEGKYSRTMFRKFIELIKVLDVVIVQLKEDYMKDFFGRHFDIILIDEDADLYKLRRK